MKKHVISLSRKHGVTSVLNSDMIRKAIERETSKEPPHSLQEPIHPVFYKNIVKLYGQEFAERHFVETRYVAVSTLKNNGISGLSTGI